MTTPVQGSVMQFIDLASGLAVLMLIWYCIKFFLVAPPTKEEKERRKAEQEEKLKGMKDFLSGKIKETKEKSEAATEKKRRKDLISPAKNHLRKAIEAAEEAINLIGDAKTKKDRKKIIDVFKDFNDEIESTWFKLRQMRRKIADGDKEDFKTFLEEIEAIKEHVNNNVKGKLPQMSPNWLTEVNSRGIIGKIKEVRAMVHNAWNKMETFHK